MTEVHAVATNDGTVYDASLQVAGTVSPFAPLTDAVPATALVSTVAAVQEERQRAAELSRQLTGAVREYSTNRPRSQQRRIGPSEVGTPCTRSLGYKVAGVEPVNVGGGDPWASFVGTAVHAELERVMESRPATEGWVTERRVTVDVDLNLHGSTDLIRLTGGVTVIDHKVVGASTLRKARTHGPADYYRTQCNLYAHGWIAAGVPVEYVAIAYWAKAGRLMDLYVWLERYQQDVADRALERLDNVRKLVAAGGRDVLPMLDGAAHFCDSCDFYQAGSTDLRVACGGAES